LRLRAGYALAGDGEGCAIDFASDELPTKFDGSNTCCACAHVCIKNGVAWT
jgi:hypothetical protein